MSPRERKYICSLDIGTSKIVTLIGEVKDEFNYNEIHVVGLGQSESKGLKFGMVNNIEATSKAISQSVEDAKLMADCKIDKVIVGITGNHIRSLNSQGLVKIKDREVSQADIDRAIETARAISIPPDHQILHTVMQEFIIDNQSGVREPIGMSGTRLDTRVHIITGSVTAIQNLAKCVNSCGLSIDSVILHPLASAYAVLSDDEKELGVCCVDIGAGTTDIAVFMNGAICHTAVIPISGSLITKDLAQALRTPHKSAEYIKIHHGVALDTLEDLDEVIEVPSVGDRKARQISRKNLASIIGPRIEEILELVFNELNRAGFKEEMLASGIVITGGTSLTPGILDLAEDIFNLPVRIGVPKENGVIFESLRNPRYSTSIGLLYQSLDVQGKNNRKISFNNSFINSFINKLRNFYANI